MLDPSGYRTIVRTTRTSKLTGGVSGPTDDCEWREHERSGPPFPDEEYADSGDSDPDRNDDGCCHLVHRQPFGRGRCGFRVSPSFRRYQSYGKGDPDREENQVVELAKHRNRIGNQTDRTQRVRDDARRHDTRQPRSPRIAVGDGQCQHERFEPARPLSPLLHPGRRAHAHAGSNLPWRHRAEDRPVSLNAAASDPLCESKVCE